MKMVPNPELHTSAYISSTVTIAEETIVGPNCYIDGDITIARGTKLVGGMTLIGRLYIGENCVLEPGVCIASQHGNSVDAEAIFIGANVYVGAGSVLVSGISIGMNARIAPGTIVSRSIPPHAIVCGNPGVIVGYSRGSNGEGGSALYQDKEISGEPGVYESAISGVTIHRFKRIRDLRGDLSVGEFSRNVPFQPKRYFLVYDVPSLETRGEHAHKKCHQFLVCVAGSVSIVVDDGIHREEVVLDAPNLGIYIPPTVWGVQYKYSRDGVLLVFASHYYDSKDYIRDYEEFLKSKGL